MAQKTYTIKSLVWTSVVSKTFQVHTADVGFGHYDLSGSSRGYLWALFDASGGTAPKRCATIEDGKAACEAHWRELLSTVLSEVKP